MIKKQLVKKKCFLSVLAAGIFSKFIFPTTIFAITNPVVGSLGNNSEEAKTGTTFMKYAVSLWKTGISIGGLLVLGLYVWGAYEWISSGSDSKGVEKARQRIINATIGLILLVSSFTIVGFIGNLFFGKDFDILKLTLPTYQILIN